MRHYNSTSSASALLRHLPLKGKALVDIPPRRKRPAPGGRLPPNIVILSGTKPKDLKRFLDFARNDTGDIVGDGACRRPEKHNVLICGQSGRPVPTGASYNRK